MVKVYSAETVEALNDATPHSSEDVEIETKSAVKTTIKVQTPRDSGARFFKVEFGRGEPGD